MDKKTIFLELDDTTWVNLDSIAKISIQRDDKAFFVMLESPVDVLYRSNNFASPEDCELYIKKLFRGLT